MNGKIVSTGKGRLEGFNVLDHGNANEEVSRLFIILFQKVQKSEGELGNEIRESGNGMLYKNTHWQRPIIKAGCKGTIGTLPDVAGVDAFLSRRANFGAGWIHALRIDGVCPRSGAASLGDIGNLSSAFGSLESICPFLWHFRGVWSTIRVLGTPSYAKDASAVDQSQEQEYGTYWESRHLDS